MILSDRDILKLIKTRAIRFEPALSREQIGPASVDLTLDGRFWVFKHGYHHSGRPVDLGKVGFSQAMEELKAKSITLPPGGLVLGITKEKIFLPPHIMGSLEGRS